jgi:DNA-directed RNA polymerase subunit RPC12/RpoP
MLLYEKIESIEIWNQWASLVSFGIVAFGLGILAYFWVRLLLSNSYKAKYDFRNLHEIKMLFYASVFLISGVAIYLTTLSSEPTVVWFIVSLFVAVMMSILAISVIHNLLNFYYPTFLEKKLQHLRYKPRISPKSGKPMKLLSEEEEDVHLDEGMQAEENIFSIDYDVWVDEETGYTQIEKYAGHLHAIECPECSYQTLKVVKEELLESPTETEPGQLLKYQNCTYCGHKVKKAFKVAPLSKISETSDQVTIVTS